MVRLDGVACLVGCDSGYRVAAVGRFQYRGGPGNLRSQDADRDGVVHAGAGESPLRARRRHDRVRLARHVGGILAYRLLGALADRRGLNLRTIAAWAFSVDCSAAGGEILHRASADAFLPVSAAAPDNRMSPVADVSARAW